MFTGFGRNRRVQVGLGILGVFVLVAIFGNLILSAYGSGPFDIDFNHLHTAPLVGGHPLGTTVTGQDVLSQLIAGSRGSMTVGLLSGVIATVLACIIGVTGGFIGGAVDQTLSGFTNLILTLPSFALTLIVAGYLSSAHGGDSTGMGLTTMALLIGIFEWPGGARYLRSQTLSLRSRDFSMATVMLGESLWRQVFVEIVPHLTGIISAMFLRAVVAGIFAEAALNFLGITTQGSISWGTMIASAQGNSALSYGYWWWVVSPGVCIALVGTATALVNFGLDEVTNPRLRTANRKVVRRFEKQRSLFAKRSRKAAA